MTIKRAVGRAFGAASGYDEAAHIQRDVADRLARKIAALPLPEKPRILEIGCGTGFLTSALRGLGVDGEWMVTDLSPEMVMRCRERLGQGEGVRYLAMDGERLPFADGARFDLICSSLAFQWLEDLPGTIAALTGRLAPGGHLAFATLASGSFGDWQALYGGDSPADYPSAAAFAGMAPAGTVAAVDEFQRVHPFATGLEFLRHFREIGAHVRRGGERPLPPGQLRRAMRAFEARQPVARYHIACCTFTRQA